MLTTVGLGTMLLGSWVLVSPVDNNLPPLPATPPPTAATQARPVQPEETAAPAETRGLPRPADQGYGGARNQGRDSRYGPRENKYGSPSRQPGDSGMPNSPTSSAQGSGGYGIPMPPTADPSMAQGQGNQPQGAMDQAYGSAGSLMPMAPTGSTARPAPSSYGSSRGSRGGRMSSGTAGMAPQTIGADNQPTQKAFSSVNPYSSGVSPYMNLFRNDTNAGTVDNYTTLVRPALEQRAANQRFNMDIYGLERRARLQQHSLQKMQQAERTLQGVGTPQYYMNYGGFYGN